MNGLIQFIEKYLNRDDDYSTNVFRVNIENQSKTQGLWIRDWNYRTLETIRLDEEDLTYLYNKYFPLYDGEKEKERKKAEDRRLKEIKELKSKIEKLKVI